MQLEIESALQHLKQGKVILYPTDTVWGLGCDPSHEAAVDKIFAIKKRSDHKAMILLIADIAQLYQYVEAVPKIAWDIVEFAEKPLTVIYPKGKNVSTKLMGQDGSIAIRLTRDGFCGALIKKFKHALVSTSANISGQPASSLINGINQQIIDSVDYVVKGLDGQPNSAPSTIIRLELDGQIQFIRK